MNLFTRIFLILFFFALIPALITGAWFLRSNSRVQENARQLHQQICALSADAVETTLGKLNRALAFVEDLEAGGEDRIGYFRLLQRAAVTTPEFSLLALLDDQGHEVTHIADVKYFPENQAVDRSADPIVLAARKTGRYQLGDVTVREGAPLLPIAYPLSKQRVLYLDYNLENLWSRIQGLRAGSNGHVLLLAAGGNPLPGFDNSLPEKDWKGLGPMPDAPGWRDSISGAQGALVGAYQKSVSLPWWVLTIQPRSEAFAIGDRFLAEAAGFLTLLGLFAVLAAYALTGRLTKPLQELIAAARQVSQNDFSRPVPKLGWGELELLGNAFNEMMQTIKSYQDLQVERLIGEKAKVEALIHTIPDGIVLAGYDGGILYMNASARGILGAADRSTMPKSMGVHELLRESSLRETVLAVMRRQKRTAQVEFDLKKPSGDRAAVFLCRAVTVTADRKDIGILLLLRDVTAEREMDKMKEEFFHSIVHDLRSPLGTIDGFIQIMKEKSALGDKDKMYLGYVQGSCDRLRQLVTDILETAKIESGQMTLKKTTVRAGDFAVKMKELYSLQAETRGLQLTFEQQVPEAETLTCDKELIERVTMNLIGNAMKFTPKGGRITLAIAPAGSDIEFSVADTGPGIPTDKLEVVFEKFKQLDKGIAVRSGYGLGLSICKRVVELHAGRIWAESAEGKGSRFVFRLPKVPAA